MRSRVAATVVIAAAVVLSGCTATAPEPSPTASTDASPTRPAPSTSPATPAPSATTPAATVTSIPPCADLLTLEQVRGSIPDGQRVGVIDDSMYALGEGLPGPLARSTYEAAARTSVCAWGIPQSDGIVHLGVALLDAASRGTLIDGLQSSTEYSSTSISGLTVFSREVTEGIGTSLAYVFDGEVWTIVQGTLVTEDTATELALAAMRAVLAG